MNAKVFLYMEDGFEYISDDSPAKPTIDNTLFRHFESKEILLPKGTIKKIIGREPEELEIIEI